MEDHIIVALIGLAGSILGAFINGLYVVRAAHIEKGAVGDGGISRAGWLSRTVASPRWLLGVNVVIIVGLVVSALFLLESRGSFLPATQNVVASFDFQDSAAGWDTLVRWDGISWSNRYEKANAANLARGPQERGLVYELQLIPGELRSFTVTHDKPMQFDIVSADFYVPETLDIADHFVGLAALGSESNWVAQSGQAIPQGQWTRMTLDLRGQYDANDTPLNSRSLRIVVFYIIRARDRVQSETISVGLDDVAVYRNAGRQVSREERGPGRMLFDFEDGTLQGWDVTVSQAECDDLQTSDDVSYRGRLALVAEASIETGGNLYIHRTLPGVQKRGVMMAQVYIPPDASPDSIVWAQPYVSTSKWQGATAQNLVHGAWNTLVWDMAGVDWDRENPRIGIQVGAESSPYTGPIYFDDIQILGDAGLYSYPE